MRSNSLSCLYSYCPPLVRFIDLLRGIVLKRSRSSFASPPPTLPTPTLAPALPFKPTPPARRCRPVVLLLLSFPRVSLATGCSARSSRSARLSVVVVAHGHSDGSVELASPTPHTPSLIFMYRNILMATFSPSAFSSPLEARTAVHLADLVRVLPSDTHSAAHTNTHQRFVLEQTHTRAATKGGSWLWWWLAGGGSSSLEYVGKSVLMSVRHAWARGVMVCACVCAPPCR